MPVDSPFESSAVSNYSHPIIAKEGWLFLAGSLVLSVAVFWKAGALASLPLWLLTAFIVQFFRDPPRVIPPGERNVLSPADGRIVAIEPVTDPFLNRPALKISVFMNVFNVHSNRAPVDGLVKQRWYNPGKFINAALDKASVENERNALWIKTDAGDDIVCVQVAGLIARRILCYKNPGDRLGRAERYGFIRFGSRVDLYLPTSARARVAIGDKVSATSTVLAELE